MWREVVRLALPIGLMVTLAVWALSRGVRGAKQSESGDLLWRRLGLASWIVGMTGLLALSVLVYSAHPKYPEPRTASLNVYNLHGTGIYLNREENFSLQLFEAMSLAGVLGGFAFGFIADRQRRTGRDREDG